MNQAAFRVVQQATSEEMEEPQDSAPAPELTPEGKNAAAVALGRLGGQKGGKVRAARLTPEQRQEIARKAAAARWQR